MPLEPVDHLDDLVVTNPTDTDPVSEGDNHIRNLKVALAAGVTGNADETRLLVGTVERLLAVGFGVQVQKDDGNMVLFYTSLNTNSFIDQIFANDVGAVALRLEDGGNAQIAQYAPDSSVFEKTWINMIRDDGIRFNFDGLERLITNLVGVLITGQAQVTEAVPTAPNDLTRKDYVDTLVAAVQADLDNVKNGFAFTGPISAPTVTEV